MHRNTYSTTVFCIPCNTYSYSLLIIIIEEEDEEKERKKKETHMHKRNAALTFETHFKWKRNQEREIRNRRESNSLRTQKYNIPVGEERLVPLLMISS
jgi:hypothetical protein